MPSFKQPPRAGVTNDCLMLNIEGYNVVSILLSLSHGAAPHRCGTELATAAGTQCGQIQERK